MELQLIEEQPYNRENRENREVTLVIPATNGTGDIKSFLNTVREKLQAKIIKIMGSAKETMVTLELEKSSSPSNILDEITNMPEVQVAEEKTLKIPVNSQQGILVILGANSN